MANPRRFSFTAEVPDDADPRVVVTVVDESTGRVGVADFGSLAFYGVEVLVLDGVWSDRDEGLSRLIRWEAGGEQTRATAPDIVLERFRPEEVSWPSAQEAMLGATEAFRVVLVDEHGVSAEGEPAIVMRYAHGANVLHDDRGGQALDDLVGDPLADAIIAALARCDADR